MANFIPARQLDQRIPEVSDTMFQSFDIDVPGNFRSRRPFSRQEPRWPHRPPAL